VNRARILAGLLALGCAAPREPAPEPKVPLPPPTPLGPVTPREAGPCDERALESGDNLSVAVEESDGKLSDALTHPPPEAASVFADALRSLPKSPCAAEVEHALPSLRVGLKSDPDCQPGSRRNDLAVDFEPEGDGSRARVRGTLTLREQPVVLDVRVSRSRSPRVMCAAGRFELPRAPSGEPPPKPEAKPAAGWLAVPFDVVKALLGLVPRGR